VVEEAQIEQRARDRDNLIDPREVLKVEVQEQKRQWVSDDFMWEATLGYREDPSVEAVGKPSDSVGIEEERNKKAEKEAAEKAAKKEAEKRKAKGEEAPVREKAKFETQEINRTIRPQMDVQPRKAKPALGMKWMVGAALFLIVVAGAGWFFLAGGEAPKKLKAVVDQGTEKLSEITNKVSSSIGEIGKSDDEQAAGDKGEEAMARLRERLEKIKAESAQKADSKPAPTPAPVAATPAVKPAPAAELVEGGTQTAGGQAAETPDSGEAGVSEAPPLDESAPQTVDDVMRALSQDQVESEAEAQCLKLPLKCRSR